uniref:Uncharacterized protein n=1 Tax=Knipowitschia caucasica TaxID=637954 RepID=A0AAV2LD75_KNICA
MGGGGNYFVGGGWVNGYRDGGGLGGVGGVEEGLVGGGVSECIVVMGWGGGGGGGLGGVGFIGGGVGVGV